MAYDLLTRHTTSRDWAMPTLLGSDEPNVWTRAAIKGERDRILGVIDAVNQDVSRAAGEKKITSSEWQQWRQAYVAAHDFLTNMSNLWGSDMQVARWHENLALQWRDFLRERGATLQGPRNPGRPKDESISVAQVALAIGGVAAAGLLITAIRK
jgi:hypothetical protein